MTKTYRALLLVGALALGLSDPALALPQDADAEVGLSYGMRAYNQGDFAGAIALFEQAAAADPDDGTVLYWLGRARLQAHDPQGAVRDIEGSLSATRPPSVSRARVLTDLGAAQIAAGDAASAERNLSEALRSDPDDPAALYMRGLALTQLGRSDEGQIEAKRARAIDPSLPGLPQQSVAPGTGELLREAQLPFFEIRLSGDYGYDSNPGGRPDDLDAFPLDVQRAGRDDEVATGNLRAEIHPFYDWSDWSLGLRADAFRSWHQDLDEFDLSRVAGVAQLAWGDDPLGYITGPMGYTRVPKDDSPIALLFQAGTAYSTLDDEGFTRTYEGAASMMIRETPWTDTQLEFDYQDLTFFSRDGFDNADGRSGYEAFLRASQYFYIGDRDRYLRVLALGGASNRDDDLFDSHFFGGGLEASWPVYRNVYLQLAGNVRYEDFDERFDGEAHDETTFNTTAAVIWAFIDHFYLTARGSYTERSADPRPLDDFIAFDRAAGSLGLTFYY